MIFILIKKKQIAKKIIKFITSLNSYKLINKLQKHS